MFNNDIESKGTKSIGRKSEVELADNPIHEKVSEATVVASPKASSENETEIPEFDGKTFGAFCRYIWTYKRETLYYPTALFVVVVTAFVWTLIPPRIAINQRYWVTWILEWWFNKYEIAAIFNYEIL
jgi:hypothetical protein